MRYKMQTLAVLGVVAGWLSGAWAQAAPQTPITPPTASVTAQKAQDSTPEGTKAAKPDIRLEATPALWKLTGVHGTVYLFGSVHVMKKEVQWHTAKVKDAFSASNTLYLEIKEADPASMQAAQPLVLKYGMDPTHPLSTKISKEDLTLLDAAAKKMGQPGEQMFEPMQPWLVNMAISLLPATNAGYDAGSGIDTTLASEALAAKKSVMGFETVEDQLHLFADAPMPEQVEMLHQTLTDKSSSIGTLEEIVGDWTRGDVDKLAAIENDELRVKTPKVYERLLVKRNAHFADVIEKLLKDPATQTVFVTVGAAHLAGPDSVQKMLEARGFTATREE
jgi:uncharacterized protein YbaP (TraB family)